MGFLGGVHLQVIPMCNNKGIFNPLGLKRLQVVLEPFSNQRTKRRTGASSQSVENLPLKQVLGPLWAKMLLGID